MHCHCDPVLLKPSVELVIYRVVHEATTNLSKYAQAGNVWVDVTASASQLGHVDVSVRDDGVGFDTSTRRVSAFGLLGMRFRVEAEGGRFAIHSQPGQGTQIQATLPALCVTA